MNMFSNSQATFVVCASIGIKRACVVIWKFPALVLTPSFGTWTFGPKYYVQDAFIMGFVFAFMSIAECIQGDKRSITIGVAMVFVNGILVFGAQIRHR